MEKQNILKLHEMLLTDILNGPGLVYKHQSRPFTKPVQGGIMSIQHTFFGIDIQDSFQTCNKCHEKKRLAEFNAHKAYKSGRKRVCSLCERKYGKTLREKRKESYIPVDPESTRRCWQCKIIKKATCFYPSHTTGHGLRSKCIECGSFDVRKDKYGITPQQFDAMFEHQDGKCKICSFPFPQITKRNKRGGQSAHIDHDHKTGKIRGLLCPRCNWALGALNDDISLFENAILYLREHSECGLEEAS